MKKPAGGGLRLGCRTTLLKKSLLEARFKVKLSPHPGEIPASKVSRHISCIIVKYDPWSHVLHIRTVSGYRT
jgi:hypothetical protein